jgi:hypothetical protein
MYRCEYRGKHRTQNQVMKDIVFNSTAFLSLLIMKAFSAFSMNWVSSSDIIASFEWARANNIIIFELFVDTSLLVILSGCNETDFQLILSAIRKARIESVYVSWHKNRDWNRFDWNRLDDLCAALGAVAGLESTQFRFRSPNTRTERHNEIWTFVTVVRSIRQCKRFIVEISLGIVLTTIDMKNIAGALQRHPCSDQCLWLYGSATPYHECLPVLQTLSKLADVKLCGTRDLGIDAGCPITICHGRMQTRLET